MAADSQVPPQCMLPMAVHGLKALMQDAQWADPIADSVPSDPAALARLLRQPVDDVAAALPHVLPYFDDSEPGRLFDPAQREYRKRVQTLSEKNALNGAKGGKTPRAKANAEAHASPTAEATATPCASPSAEALSTSTSTSTSTPLAGKVLPQLDLGPEHQQWVDEDNRTAAKLEGPLRLAAGGRS